MEKKEEEELNSSNDSEESNSNQSGEKRFILNYEQKNVRNLNVDEILNRMCELRQQSKSLETVAGPSRPSTSTQEWSTSPSTSIASPPPPSGSRCTFYPDFKRRNKSDGINLKQLPSGCARTAPSSPRHGAGLLLQQLRAPFFGCLSGDEASTSTSRSDWQPLSNPVSPRTMSSPGHPFGLGSERLVRQHSSEAAVPLEFINSVYNEVPDLLDNKENPGQSNNKEEPATSDDKGDRGEPDNKGVHDEPDSSGEHDEPDSPGGHGEPDSPGGHGEPDIKGETGITKDSP